MAARIRGNAAPEEKLHSLKVPTRMSGVEQAYSGVAPFESHHSRLW